MASIIGLDIGSASIKYVEVKQGGKTPEVVSYGLLPAPSKGLESEAGVDRAAVVEAIKHVLHEGGARSKQVLVSLPESRVFTRVIEVPKLSEKELANALNWEAEQYIPMPLEDVYMDFSQLRDVPKDDGSVKQEVLLVAAPKTLVDVYQKTLQAAGLEIIAAETDILSSARSLVLPTTQTPTLMIVNIGARTTTFAILRQGKLAFTRAIEVAGNAMTRAIAQDFSFQIPQAEEYKKAYGLDKTKIEGKVANSLSPIYLSIVEELKRSILYSQKTFPNEPISSIVLTGGSALLPGLFTNIAQDSGIEVQIGNPWSQLTYDNAKFAHMSENAPFFSVCCGLVLREE